MEKLRTREQADANARVALVKLTFVGCVETQHPFVQTKLGSAPKASCGRPANTMTRRYPASIALLK